MKVQKGTSQAAEKSESTADKAKASVHSMPAASRKLTGKPVASVAAPVKDPKVKSGLASAAGKVSIPLKSSLSAQLPAPVKVKESVKTSTVKATKPEVAVTKAKVTHAVAAGTMSKAAVSKPVPEAVVTPVDPSLPVRSGRPSSRLTQLTVPSMAQSVDSTAAKASFAQEPSLPPIIQP